MKSAGRTFFEAQSYFKASFRLVVEGEWRISTLPCTHLFHFKGMDMDTGFPLISFQEIPWHFPNFM